MNKDEFEAMLDKVLSKIGILEVSIDKEGVRWYDVNTGMKSGLSISWSNGNCWYEARYDKKGIIEDINDLLYAVKDCRCGRDYANHSWLDWFVDEGLMHKTVNTSTTVSYT